MKRALALLLSLIMCVSVFPAGAFAQEEVIMPEAEIFSEEQTEILPEETEISEPPQEDLYSVEPVEAEEALPPDEPEVEILSDVVEDIEEPAPTEEPLCIIAPEYELEVGETMQLSVNTSAPVAWSSSDENVLTVDETGLVTAIGEGKATVTVVRGDECIYIVELTVCCDCIRDETPEILTTANSFTYNSLVAAEWAKQQSNIDSVDGLCAWFVSACLRAGGLTDINYGTPGVLVDHIVNCGYGVEMDLSDESFAKLKAGDIIVVMCGNHGERWGLHTIFVTEVNHEQSYIRYSAKHNDHCNETMSFSNIRNYSSYFSCDTCGNGYNAYTVLVSMNATDIVLSTVNTKIDVSGAMTCERVTYNTEQYINLLGSTKWYWNNSVRGGGGLTLQSQADDGDYFSCLTTSGCVYSGSHEKSNGCTSNLFGGTSFHQFGEGQCQGFALYIGYVTTGIHPGCCLEYDDYPIGWTRYSDLSSDFVFHPGDYVRLRGSSAASHSIYIYKVEGDTVYYIDCNWDSHCGIETRTWSKSEIISRTNYSNGSTKGFLWRPPISYSIDINKYNVYFNSNGGTGSISPLSLDYQENFNIPTNSFSRSGYVFKGWNLYRNADEKWYVPVEGWKTESEISQNGYSKKLYSDGQNLSLSGSWIKNYDGKSDYTFYAVWECEKTQADKLVEWALSKVGIYTADDYGQCAAFICAAAREAGMTYDQMNLNATYATPYVGSGKFNFINDDGTLNYGCRAWTWKDFNEGRYVPQIGDIVFYGYLESTGGTANKTIAQVACNPDDYWHTHVGVLRDNNSTRSILYTVEGGTTLVVGGSTGYTNTKDRSISPDTGYAWTQNGQAIYILEFVRPAYLGVELEPSINASGTCGDNLKWTLDNAGTLTISGSGYMYSYSWGSSPWADYETIKNVVIENGVTSIGDYAFNCLNSIETISIPDSVTEIGCSAIAWCHGITSISIPKSVTNIDNYTFGCCSRLSSINVHDQNPQYSSVEGVLFSKDQKKLISFPGGKDTKYSIPHGVTNINVAAFRGCVGLTSVTIPNSVTEIGYDAFWSCESLENVTIPDSVVLIDEQAFAECHNLKSITLGNGITSIERALFHDCTNLLSIVIPENVNKIEGGAFYGCSRLTSVLIPNTVKMIDDYAFYDCNSLAFIYYAGSEMLWSSISIGNNNNSLVQATKHFNFKNSYTIAYDANGGTGAPPSQNKTYAVSLTLSTVVPTLSGYTFMGWATSNNAVVAEYQPGESYSEDKDVTLYAVWDSAAYTDWLPDKPTDIDESLIQTATQYRSRTVETTMSSSSALSGWTSNGSHTEYGDYGSWSDWSRSYVASNDTTQTETKAFYRYYYFQCPNCGNHTAYHGTCWCDTQVPEETYHELWSPTPYSSSNSFEYNSNKSATDSLDGQRWYFDTSNLYSTSVGTTCNSGQIVIDTFYRYRTRTIQTVYDYWRWGEWGAWGFKSISTNDSTQVETRTVYRYPGTIIYYDANGGENAPSAQAKTENIALTLSTVVPVRKNYVFLGWAEDSSATAVQYQPGDSYTKNESKTLFAVWAALSGTCGSELIWELSGDGTLTISGTGAMSDYDYCPPLPPTDRDPRSVINGSSAAPWLSCKNLIKRIEIGAGVSCIGTGAFNECSNVTEVSIPVSLTAIGYSAFYGCTAINKVCYGGAEAQWNAITVGDGNTCLLDAVRQYSNFTVTYDLNGGSGDFPQQVKPVGEAVTLSSGIPTRAGFTFLGWATDKDAAEPRYQPGDRYTADADMTLYAVWEALPDEDTPRIVVSTGSGVPENTAFVTVSLENNPGIVGMMLGIEYDTEVFTLKNVTWEGLSGSWYRVDKITWASNCGDQTYNGEILTLEFEIAKDAPLGTYPVSVSYDSGDICNYNLQKVSFAVISGGITVNNHIPGDINGDGSVGTKDFVTLMRYCAGDRTITFEPNALDINNDGKVNTLDFITLMKYVAGADVKIY